MPLKGLSLCRSQGSVVGFGYVDFDGVSRTRPVADDDPYPIPTPGVRYGPFRWRRGVYAQNWTYPPTTSEVLDEFSIPWSLVCMCVCVYVRVPECLTGGRVGFVEVFGV